MLNDLETVPFVGRTTAKNVRLSKKIASAINKSLAVENMNFNSKLGYDLRLIPEIAQKPSYYCDKDEVIYIQYNTKTKFIIPSIYVNENRKNVFFKNSFKEIIAESSYNFSQDNITNINKGTFKKIDKDLYEISNISNLKEAYQFIEKNRLDEAFSDVIKNIFTRVNKKASDVVTDQMGKTGEESLNWKLTKKGGEDGKRLYNPVGASNHLATYIKEALPKKMRSDFDQKPYTSAFQELEKGNIDALIKELNKIEHSASDTPDADVVAKVFVEYYEQKVGLLGQYKSVSDENIKQGFQYAYDIVNKLKSDGFNEQKIADYISDLEDLVGKVEGESDPGEVDLKLKQSIDEAIRLMNKSQSSFIKSIKAYSKKFALLEKIATFLITGFSRVIKALKGSACLSLAAKGLTLSLKGATGSGSVVAKILAAFIPAFISIVKLIVTLPIRLIAEFIDGVFSPVDTFWRAINIAGGDVALRARAIKELPANATELSIGLRMETLANEQETSLITVLEQFITADAGALLDIIDGLGIINNQGYYLFFIITALLTIKCGGMMLESLKEYMKIFVEFTGLVGGPFIKFILRIPGNKGKSRNLKRIYIEEIETMRNFTEGSKFYNFAKSTVKTDLDTATFEKFIKLIITNDAFGIDTKLSKSLVLKASISSLEAQKDILVEKGNALAKKDKTALQQKINALENQIKSKEEEIENVLQDTPGGKTGKPNFIGARGTRNKSKIEGLRKEIEKLTSDLEEMPPTTDADSIDADSTGEYDALISNYVNAIARLNKMIEEKSNEIKDDLGNHDSSVEEAEQLLS